MKILIEIGHPAHTHFFRGIIRLLREHGHDITVVTRNKEMTDRLLDRMGIEYISLGNPASTKTGLMAELLARWIRIFSIIKRRGIVLAASISGISTAFPSWLAGIRNITFTDTEDAALTNRISFPFSSLVVTPGFYLKDIKKKHIRYAGLQELAYLKDFDAAGVYGFRKSHGLDSEYCVVRLIAYDAVHDWSISRMTRGDLDRLIETLKPFGRVIILSQRELPEEYSRFRLDFDCDKVHYLLAGSSIFIGESPTMAVESSMLGVPAFLLSQRHPVLGNMVNLESRHRLLENFSDFESLHERLLKIGDIKAFGKEWKARSEIFVKSTDDINRIAAELIEKGMNGACAG
ncbi:MAG: DUF354 domain-containing protein [Elusimicrobia bacterium]|nr:DUF354 domain-containing protein [Elusimicrobiota bacterium]